MCEAEQLQPLLLLLLLLPLLLQPTWLSQVWVWPENRLPHILLLLIADVAAHVGADAVACIDCVSIVHFQRKQLHLQSCF